MTARGLRSLCVFLVLLGISSSAAAQTFTLHLVGQPGEWITLGQTLTFTQADASLYFIRRNSADGVTFNGVDFGILDSAGSLWDVSFNAPRAAAFIADNYEEAQRFPFNSPTKPGLIQSGEWRTCSYVDGRFVVREVVFGAANEVLSLAVDFEQHCDFTPPLFGFVRYNSTIPLVVPTPNAAAGPDLVVDEGQLVPLDGSKSSDGDGSIVAYRWLQQSGPTVVLSDPTAAVATFVAPQVPTGGSDLAFQLTVTDNDGNVDTDTAKFHVANHYDPTSSLHVIGQDNDFLLGPVERLFTVNDGYFRAFLDMGQSIYVEYQGEGSSWLMAFAAPGNGPLLPGVYEGATRYPFQAANEPGLDLSVGETGAGCNQLTGRFVVHEAEYGPLRTVVSFAADFEVTCVGATGTVTGTVRFNDALPKPYPVLTIAVTDSPDPVKVKNTLTYQITLRNQGAVDAAGVVLQTAFSDRITPVSADPRCAVTATTARCTVGQLPAGASTTLNVAVKPGRKGVLTGSTTATATGLAPVGPITTATQVQ